MNMNKTLLAVVAISALGAAGTARAADMPAAVPAYKAAVVAQALPYNWSGFYLGGNLGYGFASASANVTGPAGLSGDASEDLNGILGGVQFGYNWQYGHWVFGLEADLQASGQKASHTATCPAATCGVAVTATRDDALPWFGTARARVGYAADRLLMYVTGGLAYGEFTSDLAVTAGASSGTSSSSATKAGLAVGGGVEFALTGNWTGRLEYLYIDTGQITTDTFVTGYGTVTETERVKNNVVRAGLNYRF